MAKDKTTLRFWLRADRLNRDGTAPIHLIYQIKGQRKYYAIPNIKLLPINWNPKEQVAIYVDKKKVKKIDPPINPDLLLADSEVKEINSKLSAVTTDIRNAESRFKLDQITFSVSMILHMCVLSGIRKYPEFKNYYERKIAEGKHVMSVINALRNKLVIRVAVVVKRGEPLFIWDKHS